MALIAVLMCLHQGVVAQKHSSRTRSKSVDKTAAEKNPARPRLVRDPVITEVIKSASSEHIRQTIEKLVSFHTRHTLSVHNPGAADSDKGIVAARNWIKSEFERYSADCGGCLEVKTDTFVQPVAPRIPQPTELENVYAIRNQTVTK